MKYSIRYLEAMALSKGVVEDDDKKQEAFVFPKFVLMGHRGFGMNMLQSPDEKMKFIKENSLLSFNVAADFPIDFIEFDVQVTRDGCPVIFHDIFMFTQEQGVITGNRVTAMALDEFLSYGPQKDGTNVKPMFRQTKNGRIFEWRVEKDDTLCTLEDAFLKVNQSVGFNIELKFDDNTVYGQEELRLTLDNILKVLNDHAKNRPIIFSSFHPDAARLIRNLQRNYPVFFLTNGGCEIYKDVRRNSLDEAIKLCKDSGLQGIVSEVKPILRTPNAITRVRDSRLSLLSYGQLNNVVEVIYLQYLMGVEGVIVDMVKDISEAIANIIVRNKEDCEDDDRQKMFGEEKKKLKISKDEINFLTKFVPKLLQQ
ncbi:PREDICTED: glycerophosphodiester phosphodiesterase GDPD3-like [Camelina sativa]|uniref:glycerophosphodiester phosphodiesterase n=1 Tax=Camelina sativa TaxID=90675 RepID=A0ABM0UJF8_CAMSA|nr:PREDICTED: glycerophosphodiester phosphodiesterase GDPD3-like [Camelina sativa]